MEGVQSSTASLPIGDGSIWAVDENVLNMRTMEIMRSHWLLYRHTSAISPSVQGGLFL